MSEEKTNENEEKEDKTKKKIKKKKGPIRFEAVIPFTIVVALVTAYYALFFDSNLRKAFELASSWGYGAEVNIGELTTSIKKASVNIKGIQVTDIDQVDHNALEIAEIRFALNWDALLRAKVVINDATIENIRLNSPRKTPGKIYRSKDELKDSVDGAKDKVRDQVLENTQKKFAGRCRPRRSIGKY